MLCPKLRCLTIEDEQFISSLVIRDALVARSNHKDTPILETLTITRCLPNMIDPGDLTIISQCVRSLAIDLIMDHDAIEASDGGVSGSDEWGETGSYGPAERERYKARIKGKKKYSGSEEESLYSTSCSEGSWTSGDEIVVQNQLPFEYGRLE